VDISLLDAPSDRPRMVGEPEAGRTCAPNESAATNKLPMVAALENMLDEEKRTEAGGVSRS